MSKVRFYFSQILHTPSTNATDRFCKIYNEKTDELVALAANSKDAEKIRQLLEIKANKANQ